MVYFQLKQYKPIQRISSNAIKLFIYLNVLCLCQTMYPVDGMNTLRRYSSVDDVPLNTDDLWSLNVHNKKKTLERFPDLNQYLNSIILRQQYLPEENEESFEDRKFSALSNHKKRDYLFLRG
ncbi:hypothetical protein EWB00_010087 [Schistosoma japonicum]|uniref:Uncharacterized protein n=1 Tax=Schistosoma japonicum TaxID=6182 RepID=A0A4Z2DQD2_SCHJA|nr:hypothetical protein EWB00_010087 [Schistosoma japonicum]